MSIKKLNYDLIVILGPTASGKTRLAVKIANNINGEIISADSRQVYRNMDIGTGKDINEYLVNGKHIKYYLIDIISPKDEYNVFKFQIDFHKAISIIKNNNKNAILCGGTGLYIKAILMNYKLPLVPPNEIIRKKYEQWEYNNLVQELNSISPESSKKYLIDTKRRIIRAIELELNKNTIYSNINQNFSKPIIIGIEFSRDSIRERITKRLHQRIDQGMISEVENLLNQGISHSKLDRFGLEYRYINKYLIGELNMDEMIDKLNIAIHQFSKRQMTFFRNMEKNGIKIHWIPKGDIHQILNLILN